MMSIVAKLLCLLCLVALTGCHAELRTEMTVRSLDDVAVQVSVSFADEAADALKADAALLGRAKALFTERLGVQPTVKETKDSLRLTASVSYDQLIGSTKSNAGITGVRSASIAEVPSSSDLKVQVDLVKPSELVDAIAADADPGNVAVMMETMKLVVAVRFPGEVKSATLSLSGGQTHALEHSSTVASVERDLSEAQEATFVVVGDPSSSWMQEHRAWAYGSVAILLLCVAALLARSRRPRTRP